MIWMLTIPLAVIMAYSVLCLMINRDMGSGQSTAYWMLLAASVVILYVAWFHPVRIVLT